MYFIKIERELNELKKSMLVIGQKNEVLTQKESVLKEENNLLQKRLRYILYELIVVS